MPRGMKKQALDKLQGELEAVRTAITQCESRLETLNEKEADILQQIEMEEFKRLKEMMAEHNMTMDDLKVSICNTNQ